MRNPQIIFGTSKTRMLSNSQMAKFIQNKRGARDGTISRRMVHCGQLFPQFLQGPLEELPEGQVGQLRFRSGGGFEEVP